MRSEDLLKPDPNAQPYHEDTVFKPLSILESVILRTSPGDLLLFAITQEKAKQQSEPQNHAKETTATGN